jgi:hypothetical protein
MMKDSCIVMRSPQTRGVLDWLHAGKFGAHIPDSVGWGWWKEHKLELEGAWILTPVLPFEL